MSRRHFIRWVSQEELQNFQSVYIDELRAALDKIIVFTGGYSRISAKLFPKNKPRLAKTRLMGAIDPDGFYVLSTDVFSYLLQRGGAYGMHEAHKIECRQVGYKPGEYIGLYRKRPFVFNDKVVSINQDVSLTSKAAKKQVKKIYSGFFASKAWLKVRYQALRKYGRKCMACGEESGEIHVDHIKPRSKFPELELELSNLQILCKDCNLGKGNWDCMDWRKSAKELKSVS